MYITRADRERDSGEFRCIATNLTTGFSLTSLTATLNIFWLDETASVVLQSPETPDKLTNGVELILRCRAEGNPELQYEWYRNNLRLFRNERLTVRGKRLQINNISALDNGIYSCKVTNDAGEVDSTDNFALTLKHPHAAQIRQLPLDITVVRNDSAHFDCVYDNAAITEWYARDKGPLTNNSRMTIYPNGSLHIHRVKNLDEGSYKCVGIHGAVKDEPIQTYVVELKIAHLDNIDKDLFEPSSRATGVNVVPEKGEFEVTCKRPKGHPKPRLYWEDQKGKVISDSGRIRVDDTRLIIESAHLEDIGNYSCIAENMAGTKKGNVQIYVSRQPTIISNPLTLMVDEGGWAQFNCAFTGSPFPYTVVSWLCDDRIVKEDSHHTFVHPHNGTVIIHDVQTPDGGEYICIVNTTGFQTVQSSPASLHVKEKLKFVPVPLNRKLELGLKSKIYCIARGAVKPVVRWVKEGHPLFQWAPHIHDENGILYFDTVVADDIGKYTCIATSPQGIINATIQVDVIVSPKFTVRPSNTSAYEGYPAMIHCKAYGDPPPTIQWDKNSDFSGFDDKRFHVMENGSLWVTEVHMDDQGKYGCTAGNSGGLKREEVSLFVRSAEDFGPNRLPTDAWMPIDAKEEKQEENVMTKTVTITLGAAAAYMVLVIGLMVWCRYRRAKRKAMYLQQAAAEGTLLNKAENGDVPHEGGEMENKEPHEYKDTVKSDGEAQSSSHSQHSKRSRASYDKLQFPRHDLQTIMLLGKGDFGEVFLAKARGINDGEAETIVMVKTLHSREEGAHFNFRRELDMYHKLNHENVARLLGVCKDVEPFFMIMEYSDWGDLKQFLLATRKDNPRKSPRPPQLSIPQIVAMSNQIALGMEYLSNHRFIHKDLAARNCLVRSTLDIKISNPSLSKDTYSCEYCRYHGNQLPIRWMPAEAIFDDEFSTKSDVWSFAVLVWEIFNQAELPFQDLIDDAFLKAMKAKELNWAVAENCPELLLNLLNTCWSDSAKERPSFSEVVLKISEVQVVSNV